MLSDPALSPSADWPASLCCSQTCLLLGNWGPGLPHPSEGLGPQSHTWLLPTPPGPEAWGLLRGTRATLLLSSSARAGSSRWSSSLEVPMPLTSAGWRCAARPTYNLSGLLLLGAGWSDCEATVSRCHQLHLIPSSLSQLPRVCHRIDWHHSIGTLVHTGLSGCIMSTELANDQSLSQE